MLSQYIIIQWNPTYESLIECSAHQAGLYIYKINKNKHLQVIIIMLLQLPTTKSVLVSKNYKEYSIINWRPFNSKYSIDSAKYFIIISAIKQGPDLQRILRCVIW